MVNRAVELLKMIKGADLYIEFLNLSSEAELTRTYTLKNHPDRKESIDMKLSDSQVLLFIAWLKEEKTKLKQIYEEYPEEDRAKAYEIFAGKKRLYE